MALLLYNILFPITFVLYLPFYAVHLFHRGGLNLDFLQRLGIFGKDTAAALRGLRDPVWIHAVSVGETVAAMSFIRRLQERHPELPVVLSSTTTTGHAMALRKAPAGVHCIYCPLDMWPCVRHTLNLVRPLMLIIFEVEIWPNLILQTTSRGTPVALVNGRMSDKSARSYARWRWFFKRLFGAIDVLCVQTPEDAQRIRRVLGQGAEVHVCNTMKFDQVPDAEGVDKTGSLDEVFGDSGSFKLCAGSTHAGEEEMVCDALLGLKEAHPDLKLILVPRHHERTPDVERVLRERNLSYRLMVPREGEAARNGPVDVFLVNTTGELMNLYAACDAAYVGKSLAGNEGGHNIIEPAIFGKPILYGCNMQNFREVARLFREQDAAWELGSAAEFQPAVERLLEEPDHREALGRRAREVVETYRGAIETTLDHIEPYLGQRR